MNRRLDPERLHAVRLDATVIRCDDDEVLEETSEAEGGLLYMIVADSLGVFAYGCVARLSPARVEAWRDEHLSFVELHGECRFLDGRP